MVNSSSITYLMGMPRKPIIRSNEHFYHLTGRSNNKEDFYLPTKAVWRIMTFEIRKLQIEHDLKIGAFVLMDNHYHLLLLSPNVAIDRIMYFFMKRVTLKIQKETGRINKIFGGRYKGCLIVGEQYLFNVYKYIYRNPVRAGICEKVEEYPFSTFNRPQLELENLFFSTRKTEVELRWLNREFSHENSQSIRHALKRVSFKPAQRWASESPFAS